MKKFILLAAFGVAGLVNAKNSEITSIPQKSIEKNYTQFVKEKAEFKNMLLRYGYSYQSTCGWTFSMFSEVSISDMTPAQFDEYQLDLIDMNAYVCKLHGEKASYNFTFIKEESKEVKTEKV